MSSSQRLPENLFPTVRIVLVETTHPGNIGAAARAMKNMGVTRLYLVNPLLAVAAVEVKAAVIALLLTTLHLIPPSPALLPIQQIRPALASRSVPLRQDRLSSVP